MKTLPRLSQPDGTRCFLGFAAVLSLLIAALILTACAPVPPAPGAECARPVVKKELMEPPRNAWLVQAPSSPTAPKTPDK